MNLSIIKTASIFLLFFILAFCIYSNTFEAPFLFDDVHKIEANPHIRIKEFSFKNIEKACFNKMSSSRRPVGNISFALNYYFHQNVPKGYRIVNIIIHALNGIILFFLINVTLNFSKVNSKYDYPLIIAFLSALLWLVNPVHTQSVTYIVQRYNSMAAMFFLLSLLFYAKGRICQIRHAVKDSQNKTKSSSKSVSSASDKTVFSFLFSNFYIYYSISAIMGVMALGTKENAAILPVFVFLYEWYFIQDLSKAWLKRNFKYILGVVILFGIISAVYLGKDPLGKISSLRDYSQNKFTFFERTLTQSRVVIYYLSLLFFPHPDRLNLDHNFPISRSLIDPVNTLFSLCAIIAFVGIAIYLARRERLLSFCIFWFLGNLIIESSLIPLAIIFEHRTYLPSMFVCLLVVALGYRLIRFKWLGVVLIFTVAVVFSCWTYQRNKVWCAELILWQDVVDKSPQKSRPHYNLGLALGRQGRIEEALEHYLEALKIQPDYAEVHNNLGNVLDKQGHTEKAIAHYMQALRIKPDYAEAHNNLGVVLEKKNRTQEAIAHYSQALRIKPDFKEAHYNIGLSLDKQGRTQEAIAHYSQALRIKPDFIEAYYKIGADLSKQGRLEEAIAHYLKALQLKPDYADAHNNLGNALKKQGRTEEAIAHYLEALRLKPDYVEAHNNLGTALNKQGRTKEAIDHYLAALRLMPDFERAHNNLGVALFRKGDIKGAIVHFKEALRIKPNYVNAHYNLGGVLFYKGDIEGAIACFSEALRIKPDHVHARNNLKKLLVIKRQNQ